MCGIAGLWDGRVWATGAGHESVVGSAGGTGGPGSAGNSDATSGFHNESGPARSGDVHAGVPARAVGGGTDLATIAGRMADALAHRGPDDRGVWSDPVRGIALGHRRLSIVDLSEAGHQPMHSEDGRWVLTLNGEIYNFQELRREIEGSDSPPNWRGHSDTEVLLAAIVR